MIAVGAVGEDGEKAEFSSYGFGMPLVAPGVLVQSTMIEGAAGDRGSRDRSGRGDPHRRRAA